MCGKERGMGFADTPLAPPFIATREQSEGGPWSLGTFPYNPGMTVDRSMAEGWPPVAHGNNNRSYENINRNNKIN